MTPIRIDDDGAPHLTYERRTLPCGLDVIVHRDDSAPMACASVWYRVGSSDERADRTGLAHLFEHLFKNSLHLPAKHYELLRAAGANEANASTGPDRTAYHEVVPSNELALALWNESDRMGFFRIDAERLALQQAVVRSERRQRYEDVPYGPERFALALALYPDGHPHRHLTIGTHEHLQAATASDIEGFYRTWYVPANATLVLAGDLDGDADALVDRYFGTFPASARPARPDPAMPRLTAPVIAEVDDRFATLSRIHRAWHAPAAFADGEAELDVLTAAWSAAGTGALWQRLVYDTQLAQRVSAWNSTSRLGGEVHVVVDLRPGADPARVRAILDDVCARPIDDVQIRRAITRREAGSMWALTSLAKRAQLLQRYALYTGDPDGLAGELALFRKLTVTSIDDVRRTWLRPEAMVEIATTPRSGTA